MTLEWCVSFWWFFWPPALALDCWGLPWSAWCPCSASATSRASLSTLEELGCWLAGTFTPRMAEGKAVHLLVFYLFYLFDALKTYFLIGFKSTKHKLIILKVTNNSVAFSIFTVLCNHHFCLVPEELLHYQEEALDPLNGCSSSLPSPSPWQSAVCILPLCICPF